jgi:hypothetical protein
MIDMVVCLFKFVKKVCFVKKHSNILDQDNQKENLVSITNMGILICDKRYG